MAKTDMKPPSGEDQKGSIAVEKKARKPRTDWGYGKLSTIEVLPTEKKYNGLRSEVYGLVVKANGWTVEKFAAKHGELVSAKGTKQSVASWLHFFHNEGVLKLNKPAPAEAAA